MTNAGFVNPNWRYSVSVSAGVRDGKRVVVWDAHERRAVSWHRSFIAAQKAAKKLNRKEN